MTLAELAAELLEALRALPRVLGWIGVALCGLVIAGGILLAIGAAMGGPR